MNARAHGRIPLGKRTRAVCEERLIRASGGWGVGHGGTFCCAGAIICVFGFQSGAPPSERERASRCARRASERAVHTAAISVRLTRSAAKPLKWRAQARAVEGAPPAAALAAASQCDARAEQSRSGSAMSTLIVTQAPFLAPLDVIKQPAQVSLVARFAPVPKSVDFFKFLFFKILFYLGDFSILSFV